MAFSPRVLILVLCIGIGCLLQGCSRDEHGGATAETFSASCNGNCDVGGDYTCKSRVEWKMSSEGGSMDLDAALTLVNQDCTSQCSCASSDFGVSSCNVNCDRGGDYTCKSRVEWKMSPEGGSMDLDAALKFVNQDCTSQCSCASSDFGSVDDTPARRRGTPRPSPKPGTCVETLVIGDFGTQDWQQEKVANGLEKVAGQLNPDFILGLGDNVYEHGESWKISNVMGKYTSKPALQKPWYMILGNHDWYNDATGQKDYADKTYWKMPGLYYKTSHQAGDVTVDIFHIDTEIWTCFADIGSGGGGYKQQIHWDKCGQYQELQKNWLRQELSVSSASHKVVVGHHPMWSIGAHGHEEYVYKHLRENSNGQTLATIMKEHGANIYMSGHDHSLQYNYENGFHQIISGAGAKTSRDENWGYLPGGVSNRFFHGDRGFVGVRFCRDEVTLTAYNSEGNSLNDFELS